MVSRFDFSPACLRLTAQMKQVQLSLIAGVSPATVSRWCDGVSSPDVEQLRRMANSAQLPEWFREECAGVVVRHPGREESGNLDADGDGRVTVRDAGLLDARKQEVAAERRLHLEEEVGARGGRGSVTEGEVVEQRRLAGEERELSERENRVLEFVARGRS